MRQPIHRRAILRGMGQGAGLTVALPFLEAMLPSRYTGTAAAATSGGAALPGQAGMIRFVLLYPPNGIHTPAWYPKTEGANWESTPSLAPLERHRKDILVMGGLAVPTALLDQAGDHAKALSCYM